MALDIGSKMMVTISVVVLERLRSILHVEARVSQLSPEDIATLID